MSEERAVPPSESGFGPRPPAPDASPAADGPVLHRETQCFVENRVVVVVLAVEALVAIGVVAGVLFGRVAGPPWPFALLIVLAAVVPGLVLCGRLVTTVTPTHLSVRFPPFPGPRVPIERIRSVEALTYRPIIEGGGWGWRISPTYHRVYNVAGNRGVHVRYGEGRREQFLVGSRDPEALVAATEAARNRRGDDPRGD